MLNPFRRGSDPHVLVVSMTGVKLGERVAQIGCAHGGRLAAVAAKVGLSGRAVAIVPDEASAARATTGAAEAGVLVDVETSPPTRLPVEDEAFDLAVIDEAEIERRYGIPGTRYFDFAVLRGDPSDGLPGVRGIGEKTAGALVAKYGSLDAVVEAARGATSGPLQKVASSLDYIERARTVVRIATEAPIGEVDASFPQHPPDEKLTATAESHGLAGPVRRLLAAMAPA